MRLTTSILTALLVSACDPAGRGSERAGGYLDQVTVAYGAASPEALDAQFRWLQENGIDGVGLHRLVSETVDGTQPVRTAAEAHGRVFFIQYELASATETGWDAQLRHDWDEVLHVTDSSAYARQDGRPVVLLQGLGFADGAGTVAQAMDVIDWFKARGCFVVGGVPTGWRTGAGLKPNFLAALVRLDALQPVAVGTVAEAEADQAFAAQLGIAYQPVISPGPIADQPLDRP